MASSNLVRERLGIYVESMNPMISNQDDIGFGFLPFTTSLTLVSPDLFLFFLPVFTYCSLFLYYLDVYIALSRKQRFVYLYLYLFSLWYITR